MIGWKKGSISSFLLVRRNVGAFLLALEKLPHRPLLCTGQSGSVALEYGIILPVVFVLVLGTIDLGRLIWTAVTLSRAIEAAARCGSVNTNLCGTASQIQQDAVSEAWTLTVTSSNFAVASQACGLNVSASYTFTFFTPGLGSVTLNPAACFPQ